MEQHRHRVVGAAVGGAILLLLCTACLFDDIYGSSPPEPPNNLADAGGSAADAQDHQADAATSVDARGQADAAAPSDGGTCVNVNGTWAVTGSCPVTSCTFSQTGCSATLDCGVGITGQVTITDHTVSVEAGPGTCSLTVDANLHSMHGTCEDVFGSNSCDITGTH
jgi:hypothetical protein